MDSHSGVHDMGGMREGNRGGRMRGGH
jgi:hypothetical protein